MASLFSVKLDMRWSTESGEREKMLEMAEDMK